MTGPTRRNDDPFAGHERLSVAAIARAARERRLNGPVLVLGGHGMLARSFRELLASAEVPARVVGRGEVDVTDPASVARASQGDERTWINCSAWTDVDGAETQEAAATRVNGDAVALLAHACAERGKTLVHFSTDYVFNGQASQPWRVDAHREPVNAYGRSKAAGEQAFEAVFGADGQGGGGGQGRGGGNASGGGLCLRTSWLYAPWGKNFVRTIAKAARERPVLNVVNDQRGRPTSCDALARVTLAMLAAGARGIHHATDAGECTWFDFASEIARLLGTMHPGSAIARVDPCTSAQFPRPAKRPAYSVLDLSATERLAGPLPDWRTTLADVMKRLE